MKKLRKPFVVCILCSLFILPATAKQRRPASVQITGIYSNMRYVEEAGDVVGIEIFIVDGGHGYYATVQIAEGAPEPPIVVKVEVKGSMIEFIFSDDSGIDYGKFVGKISAKGLTGKFQTSMKSEFLSRKRSYWQ